LKIPARGYGDATMPADEVYVVLWLDEHGPQCAVYEDREEAESVASLARGRVVARPVFPRERERAGRFERS
jgi:hypothetical protein